MLSTSLGKVTKKKIKKKKTVNKKNENIKNKMLVISLEKKEKNFKKNILKK